MAVNDLASADLKLLGSAKLSVSNNDWNNFDFGTPDDLKLSTLANYKPGDKLLIVFTATAASGSDLISYSVQDAPDNAGSIGTPATATTDGALTDLERDAHAHTFVRVKSDRPWLRVRVSRVGTAATFTATAKVFAVGSGV